MPNKKQSARPAESGWLLEVGVFGIHKTLKLLRVMGNSLLNTEQLLRDSYAPGVDKSKLPFMQIAEPIWMKAMPRPFLRGTWKECLARAIKEEGRKLTQFEEEELRDAWLDEHYYRPGSHEAESFRMGLDEHELIQKKKGKGPKGRHRPSLERWMMNGETFKLFRPGPLDNDTERKKLERIRAHSRALGDALKVIAGDRRGIPAKYDLVTEAHLKGGARECLAEIINYSKSLPRKREESLALSVKNLQAELIKLDEERARIIELDKKRAQIVARINDLNSLRKKVGRNANKVIPVCSC